MRQVRIPAYYYYSVDEEDQPEWKDVSDDKLIEAALEYIHNADRKCIAESLDWQYQDVEVFNWEEVDD